MPFPIQENVDISPLTRIISRKEIDENIEEYTKAISFYRWYPDLFIDLMVEASGPDCDFKLHAYQRIMLRAMARYPECNLTFSRGTSKSFTNVLFQFIKCILYPGTKGTVCAATKEQSADILGTKAAEVLDMIPAFQFEIAKQTQKDGQIKIIFKNGSWLRNIATKGTTRGQRSTIVTTEEIIICDPDNLQSVVRPLLAIPRHAANGEVNLEEDVRRQEIILTTAGYKGTYAYQRLLANLIRMVVEPGKAIVLGGSYRIPVLGGLQDMEYIRTQMTDSNYNPTHFPREFLSQWSSGSEAAFFAGDNFDRLRSLQEPEFEAMKNMPPTTSYIFSIDVGRLNDTTEITVIKRVSQPTAVSLKYIVNIVTLEKMSFPQQAVEIKKLYNKYKPIACAIDGNGIGAGLIDELVIPQIDAETGLYLQPWQVANDEKGDYISYVTPDGIPNLLFIYKANQGYNTLMYGNLQTQLATNRLRFLQEERLARARVEASKAKRFKDMTEDEKMDYLLPFYQTSFLKTQLINLESKNEGANLILKRINTKIKKDKVSSLGIGLYHIKLEYDDKMSQTKSNIMDVLGGLSPIKGRETKTRLTFNTSRKYK